MSPKQSQKRHSAVPPKTATAHKSAAEAVRDAVEAAVPVSKAIPVSNSGTTATLQKTDKPAVESSSVTVKSGSEHQHPVISAVSPVAQNVSHCSQSQSKAEEVAGLVYALRDPDADIARDAAAALGNTGDASAVTALIAALANIDGYTHPVVRAAAAASLGQLGNALAVEPLIAALSDPMAEASAEAVRALAILGDSRAVPELISIVRNADGFFLATVRRAAVLALVKLGGPLATAELQAVAANESEDTLLREEAAVAVKA